MASEFTIDIRALESALRRSPEAIRNGISRGLTDVKNDWQTEAENISPLKAGHLREALDSEIKLDSDGQRVEIGVMGDDLRRSSGKNFNYAYYIHDGPGNAVSGEKKFLDVPAQQRQGEWAQMLEREIEAELRQAGWR